jgi:hypothetical protein
MTGDELVLKGGRSNKYCSDDTNVRCDRDAVGAWEKFKIERSSAIDATALLTNPSSSSRDVYLKGGRENKYCEPLGTGKQIQCNWPTKPSTPFKLNDIGSGEYTLQLNNKYCSDDSSGYVKCDRDAVGAWEKFKGTMTGDELVLKGGRSNKYCSDDSGFGFVKCNRDAVGGWEKFKMER